LKKLNGIKIKTVATVQNEHLKKRTASYLEETSDKPARIDYNMYMRLLENRFNKIKVTQKPNESKEENREKINESKEEIDNEEDVQKTDKNKEEEDKLKKKEKIDHLKTSLNHIKYRVESLKKKMDPNPQNPNDVQIDLERSLGDLWKEIVYLEKVFKDPEIDKKIAKVEEQLKTTKNEIENQQSKNRNKSAEKNVKLQELFAPKDKTKDASKTPQTVHNGWPYKVEKLPYFYSQMALYPELAARVWNAITNKKILSLTVEVISGENLLKTEVIGFPDPYVKVIYGKKRKEQRPKGTPYALYGRPLPLRLIGNHHVRKLYLNVGIRNV